MSSDVESWLGRRMEGVPGEFRPWLEVDGGAPRADDPVEGSGPERAPDGEAVPTAIASELARRGLQALSDATARPGRNREAAFRLLAADAYLTYASEAILEDPEPAPALRKLIRRIGDLAE